MLLPVLQALLSQTLSSTHWTCASHCRWPTCRLTLAMLTHRQDQDAVTSPGEALLDCQRCQSPRRRALRWRARRATEGVCPGGPVWSVRRHRRLATWRRLDQFRLLLLVYHCPQSVHGQPFPPILARHRNRALSWCRSRCPRSALHHPCCRGDNETADHEQGRAQGHDCHCHGRSQWRGWLDRSLARTEGEFGPGHQPLHHIWCLPTAARSHVPRKEDIEAPGGIP